MKREPTETEAQAVTERIVAALEIRRHSSESRAGFSSAQPEAPLWSPAPPHTPPTETSAPIVKPVDRAYQVSEILQHDDAEFVFVAFEVVLGRPPTVRESDHYLGLLRRRDMSKIGVLGELRFANADGRKRRADVKGLLTAFLWEKRFRVPLVGRMFKLADALAKLPQAVAYLDYIERAIEVEQRLTSPQALRSDRAMLKSLDRQLADLRRRIGLEEGTAAPLVAAQAKVDDVLDPETSDRIYVAIEAAFRGSPDEVRRRLRVHLPVMRDVGAGTPDRPIIDLACGRGEWLDLLKDEGLAARGVDMNRRFIAANRARGLMVDEGDLFDYLGNLGDSCVGGLTAFHLIEHLPFPSLVRLFTEAHRVLIPGGVALFETPNPENVLTATRMFYLDPTHLHPIPPDLARCLLLACGFNSVDITRLQPEDAEKIPEDGTEIARRFNVYFYGCRDYAAIARKVSDSAAS